MKYVECCSCSGRSLAESVEINEIIDWPFKKVIIIMPFKKVIIIIIIINNNNI